LGFSPISVVQGSSVNTKHIEFVFTGPPQADIGQLVKVIDDNGDPIDKEIGGWYHDGQYWRFQIPVELVPRLVVPQIKYPTYGDILPKGGHDAIAAVTKENEEQAKRRALKEKVTAARTSANVPQDDWLSCPECKQKFDPRKDSLIDCMNCLEPRCTAQCLPDPAGKCLVCQALEADAEEGGYDPRANKEGKGRVLGDEQAQQADDDTDEDDEEDE